MLLVFSSGIQPKMEILVLLTTNVGCYIWLLINHSRWCVLQNTFQGLKKRVEMTKSLQCCVLLLDRNGTKEPLVKPQWWLSVRNYLPSNQIFEPVQFFCILWMVFDIFFCKESLGQKKKNKYSLSFWQVKRSSISPQSPAGDQNVGHHRGDTWMDLSQRLPVITPPSISWELRRTS